MTVRQQLRRARSSRENGDRERLGSNGPPRASGPDGPCRWPGAPAVGLRHEEGQRASSRSTRRGSPTRSPRPTGRGRIRLLHALAAWAYKQAAVHDPREDRAPRRRRPMRGRAPDSFMIFAAAAWAVLAYAGGSGCSRGSADSKEKAEQAVLVDPSDVVTAVARRLEAGVSFTGEMRAMQTVDVIARFDGDLEKVLVREGQAVRQGQALAIYRPRDIKDQQAARRISWPRRPPSSPPRTPGSSMRARLPRAISRWLAHSEPRPGAGRPPRPPSTGRARTGRWTSGDLRLGRKDARPWRLEDGRGRSDHDDRGHAHPRAQRRSPPRLSPACGRRDPLPRGGRGGLREGRARERRPSRGRARSASTRGSRR
jgi:hypothetical protein